MLADHEADDNKDEMMMLLDLDCPSSQIALLLPEKPDFITKFEGK